MKSNVGVALKKIIRDVKSLRQLKKLDLYISGVCESTNCFVYGLSQSTNRYFYVGGIDKNEMDIYRDRY